MGEAKNIYFTCLKFVKERHWCLAEGPSRPKMGSHKTLKIKKVLAKKQKQNRPIPQWIRMRTEHDPIQRQEASLEENEAQALNAFFRDVECARFQEPLSRGTSVLLFSHGDFSQLSWIKNSTITIWHQCNIRIFFLMFC